MTTAQAYQVLNVKAGAGPVEIEQAYRDALRALQLQLVPGQPVAVRQQAQTRIAELKSAFEFLKNMAAPAVQPTSAGGPTPSPVQPVTAPQVQPVAAPPIPPAAIPQVPPMAAPPIQPAAIPPPQPFAGFPVQPTAIPPVQPGAGVPGQPPGMVPNPFGSGPVVSYPWIIPAGFVLAATVMLSVVLLCVSSVTSPGRQETARLRVLSVPWSDVTVDGTSLGPSGQLNAFALKPGEHKLTLRRGTRVLFQTLHLPEESETVIKAQFEKGQIDVAHKRI